MESLRRLAPVSDAEAATVFGDVGCEDLLTGVMGLPFGRAASRRPHTHRRRLVLALAVLGLALIASAATWVVLEKAAARETTSVECVIKGVDTIIPSTSGDPAHDCAVEWQRELHQAAPPLAAYDNGVGGVTVILRSQTPPTGYKRLVGSQDVDLIELQASLDDYVNGLNSSCLDSTAATNLTRAKLAQFGFAGWTVALRVASAGGSAGPAPAGTKKAPGEESAGNTCWNVDVVDPSTQSVTLIAAPDQNGAPQTQLADKLRAITQSCESLPAAAAATHMAASDLGLSESTGGYDLNTVADNSLHCASVYETVGGTIFLTVRGPSH